MSDHLTSAVLSILVAIIGVAALAVLLSKSSQTGTVLTSGAGGFARMLQCAMSPITGASCGGSKSPISIGGGSRPLPGREPIPDVNSTITFEGV